MNEAIKKLYKGLLRVLLVLLHDFPEFLSEYHISFCDVIPITCMQLRNLVLSAFPRTMRLPDPYTHVTEKTKIAEFSQPPKILADYVSGLNNIRQRLDGYLTSKMPVEFPTLIPRVLRSNDGAYNVTFISIFVVYIGAHNAQAFANNQYPIQDMSSTQILKHLLVALDVEGKHHVLNAMVNQLRYPNSHTNFFSHVLLHLFMNTNAGVQELMTRVLLERLIVHKPHPWGLLVTYIELIKIPKYVNM